MPKGPPQPSHLVKATPHHTSPAPGDVQTQTPPMAPVNPMRKMKKMPEVPMHVTKHSNPVGRPKNPRY